MMTAEQYDARLAQLKSQTADIAMTADVLAPLLRVVRQTIANYDDIDPSILGLEEERVEELAQLLESANLHLSHLDLFDLERLSLCAEGYYDILGGAKALMMDESGLAALTRAVAAIRRKTFGTGTRAAP